MCTFPLTIGQNTARVKFCPQVSMCEMLESHTYIRSSGVDRIWCCRGLNAQGLCSSSSSMEGRLKILVLEVGMWSSSKKLSNVFVNIEILWLCTWKYNPLYHGWRLSMRWLKSGCRTSLRVSKVERVCSDVKLKGGSEEVFDNIFDEDVDVRCRLVWLWWWSSLIDS